MTSLMMSFGDVIIHYDITTTVCHNFPPYAAFSRHFTAGRVTRPHGQKPPCTDPENDTKRPGGRVYRMSHSPLPNGVMSL